MKAHRIWTALALVLASCGPRPAAEPAPGQHAEHAEEEGHLKLSREQQEKAGITLRPAQVRPVRETLTTTGTLESDPELRVDVTSRTPGRILALEAAPGQAVRTGDPLVVLDSVELAEALLEYRDAELRVGLAERNLARARDLARLGDEARRPLEEARQEHSAATAEVASARAERTATAARLARTRQLLREGIASRQQFEEAESADRASAARVRAAEERLRIAAGRVEREALLEWFLSPELRNLPGVIEVNNFGGFEKQCEVQVDPRRLVAFGLTLGEVREALARNNANAGGAYLVSGGEQLLLRGEGLLETAADIGDVVVRSEGGRPVYVRDLGEVRTGHQVRSGAATRDGKGETVLGMAILLKGENSRTVTRRVKQRLEQLQASLPPGVAIRPFYDRSDLVGRTIGTAARNLVEGGLLVAGVLFLFLLQLRAGLIVSSATPLAMLVALIGMRDLDVSANLMSLGAIDFGLIVDAAVIIVENCVRRLAEARRALGRALTPEERRQAVLEGTVEVRRASQFGELMILAAYLPILALPEVTP